MLCFRPAFDMQTWAMKQCWNEVWQLRHGCSNLIEEKLNLLRCVQQQRHINSATINWTVPSWSISYLQLSERERGWWCQSWQREGVVMSVLTERGGGDVCLDRERGWWCRSWQREGVVMSVLTERGGWWGMFELQQKMASQCSGKCVCAPPCLSTVAQCPQNHSCFGTRFVSCGQCCSDLTFPCLEVPQASQHLSHCLPAGWLPCVLHLSGRRKNRGANVEERKMWDVQQSSLDKVWMDGTADWLPSRMQCDIQSWTVYVWMTIFFFLVVF